jgi:AraC family transcriptional regulator, regulatory protein of adaptative response / methylated-DNA-[protein]-cysteine methyltransferase
MSARCMFLSCGRLNPIRMPWSPRSYNPPQGSRRLTIPFASKDRVVAATSSLYSEIMRDYERIKAIIEFLDESRQEQPGLEELSAAAGLSPFHLHRLFSDWAGITPKAFLKCLTLNHAKELLRAGESVLSTSLEAGLSGPGRLHDLCVSLESASPGEIKAGGNGWTIKAGVSESPFGLCLIAGSPRGICHLSFVPTEDRTPATELLREDWPAATLRWDNSFACELAARLFVKPTENGSNARLKAYVRGTDFQVRVWRALLTLPPESLTSYGRIGKAIGSPDASRAVGTAVGRNPLAVLIPCHRVIRETGVIGDYRWGMERKKAILAWENAER